MSFNQKMAIIGGLGPHAGVYALQVLLEQAGENYGAFADHEYPEVILHSVPFRGSSPNGIQDASIVLAQEKESLSFLQNGGVKIALFACNSSHAFLDQLQTNTAIEIISLVGAAEREITAHPAQRFGILASQSTRNAGLYEQIVKRQGRDVVATDQAFQDQVNDLIAEAMRPKINALCINMFEQVLTALIAKGAEAVILGCTEISRLHDLTQNSLPKIDSLRAATNVMLKKSWQPQV